MVALPRIRLSNELYSDVSHELEKQAKLESGSAWLFRPEELDARSFSALLVLWCMVLAKPCSCFSVVVRYTGSVLIDTNHCNDFYVLFDTEQTKDEFIQWYSGVDISTGLFASIARAGDTPLFQVPRDMGTDLIMDQSTFEPTAEVTRDDVKIMRWMLQNCTAPFYRYGKVFFFESPDDALKFKLTWG